MTSRILTAGLVAGMLAAAGSWPGAQPASRAPRNAAELDALFQQVKNCGRWGAGDQLGSANLVTVAKRKQVMDRYAVSYHGYARSHIDALCHILSSR